ncbi:hypothetical protein, partial [Streptomyces acidiscabies]|uniref:hypothetical protein n=1 Tax=Streptomyces acidiscabies TaxID=42234 RepID=UPI001C4B03D1
RVRAVGVARLPAAGWGEWSGWRGRGGGRDWPQLRGRSGAGAGSGGGATARSYAGRVERVAGPWGWRG